MPSWIACARPSPPAACRCASTWTTPRFIAASNWRASPPQWASSSCIPRHISPRAEEKSNAIFGRYGNSSLANLDRKQTLSLDDLNERLWAWIENAYHRSEHSALGTTPLARWQRDIEHIRQLPPATDLRRLFFHRLNRLVRRDCTFVLGNRFYEAPPQLAGETVEVRFDPLDGAQVEIYFEGNRQGVARPVDPVVNAQLPSSKPVAAPRAESTGINFVELLNQTKDAKE